MQATAILRGVRLSAQKGRLVADQIRGLPVDRALRYSRSTRRRSRGPSRRCCESAIANAEHNDGADIDELSVKTIYIDKADMLKRTSARAKGRGNVISKQSCHIHVVVGDGN